MSNAPSQRRISQTQPSAESWHSVPSHHTSASSSGNNDPQSNDRAGSPEVIVDLTSGHALDHRRDSDASAYRIRSGEKKKCWICLIEEGENLSNGNPMNTSRWAKACACSLDAHESCLITWINQSRGGDANKTMSCPQCKEPYRLQQKSSAFYKLASYYNKRIDRIAPFLAGFGAVGGAYIALTVHGWYSLCTFCGEDLALRLMSDENWSRPSYIIRMLFGMQFIPIWLLASRTRYLDSVLPFLPLAFIEQDTVSLYPAMKVTLFPVPRHETLPPGLTVCLLPWLRVVYNKLWDRIIVPWEKSWEDVVAGGQPALLQEAVEENNIVVQIVDDAAVEGGVGGRNNQQIGNANGAVAQQGGGEMEDVLLATNLTTLCRKIVGAMLLPDACSLAGFILGQIPWVRKRIPDRFSRNVIGGIVFLVLKDAASVWYRYSAVKSKRSLRVLDYEGRVVRRGRATVR